MAAKFESVHLGDGAYVGVSGGSVVVTADHHLTTMASNTVCLGRDEVKKLVKWFIDNGLLSRFELMAMLGASDGE